VLKELRQKTNELAEMLENYHRYDYNAFSDKVEEIESIVDSIITSLRGTKLTDLKYKVFTDMLSSYNTTVEALKSAIYSKDYFTARKRLEDLNAIVRNLYRHLTYLSTDIYLPSLASELEAFFPKGEIAERYDELDYRLKRASYVARIVFAKLLDAPLREINLEKLPLVTGITDKKALSRAIEELKHLLPDFVAVTPDIRLGGLKLVLKR